MTAALEGGEWWAARPGRTLLPGNSRYPLYRRLGGPQGRSGRVILLFKRWSCPCPQNGNLYREEQYNRPAPRLFTIHSTLYVDWSEWYSTLPCRFSSIKKAQYPLNCGLIEPWNRRRSFGGETMFVPVRILTKDGPKLASSLRWPGYPDPQYYWTKTAKAKCTQY